MYVQRVKRGLSKKLAALWKGPYTVLQPINKVTYKIKLIGNNRAKPILAHISRLKAYIESNLEDATTDYDSNPDSSDGEWQLGTESVQEVAGVSDDNQEEVLSEGRVTGMESDEHVHEEKYTSDNKEEGEVSVSDIEYEYESGKVNAIYMHGYSTDEDEALVPISQRTKPIYTHNI